MNTMVEITIPVIVHKQRTMRYGLECDPEVPDKQIPINIRQWIGAFMMKGFEPTHEEDKYMEYLCNRKMTFEVEVEYNQAGKAINANCHTVCPMFVAAWVEKEAMKQFNQRDEKQHA